MNILFHVAFFNVRGTCVALYDYANYNEIILGGQSTILAPLCCIIDIDIYEKFKNRFKIIIYNSKEQFEEISKQFDVLYDITHGKNPGLKSQTAKSIMHCVFDMSIDHPGVLMAGVSQALAKKYKKEKYVPHMISFKPSKTKENMRKELGINEKTVVYGRHGGMDTFDLKIGWAVINGLLSYHKKDVHFIFVNTKKFFEHERITYIDKITDNNTKNRFIMTCDYNMEFGTMGHTFGLSIGEFAVNNIPTICYSGEVYCRAHIDILGDKGIYFQTDEELFRLFMSLDRDTYKNRDNNSHRDYTPEKVMKIFKKVFLD